MATLALSAIRDRAAALADVVVSSTSRHTETAVNAYINDALEEYHLILTEAGHPQRNKRATATTSSSTTVTLGWPLNQYVALPSDFMALIGVFLEENGELLGLSPFGEIETEEQISREFPTGVPRKYRISEDTNGLKILRLLPPSAGAYTIVVSYIPTPTSLSSDGSTFAFFTGTSDVVVCDAALKILEKDGVPESAQYQAIQARKFAAVARLQTFAALQNRAGPIAMVETDALQSRRFRGGWA